MRCACLKKCKWLFCLYCIGMLVLLFGVRLGMQGQMRWNIRPLDTIGRYLWVLRHSGNARQRLFALVNLGGNVLLFIPLGFFLPMLATTCRGWWKGMLWLLLILLAVELTQLVTRLGTCDVDDLLLNLAGTQLGWILWKIGTFCTSRT